MFPQAFAPTTASHRPLPPDAGTPKLGAKRARLVDVAQPVRGGDGLKTTLSHHCDRIGAQPRCAARDPPGSQGATA